MIPLAARTLEEAAERLPAMLRSISAEYCEGQGIDDYRDVGLLELALAGHSVSKGRMRLWQYGNYQDYQPDETPDWTGAASWPVLPSAYMPAIAGFPTDANLVQIIQAVGAWFESNRQVSCGQRIGGEIIVTELTPLGISSRVVHRFDDYKAVRHAAAAVASRYLRGDLPVDGVVASGLVPVDNMVDTRTGERLQQRAA
jgi:hypothetical protein